MKILTIIPIAKGIPRNELSYFSAKEVSIGTLVTVMFGNRSIRGIVIDAADVQSLKSSIKSSEFKLRNVTTVHTDIELPRNIFTASHATALFYAQPTGKILKTMIPDQVFDYYLAHPLSPDSLERSVHKGIRPDIGAIQIPYPERISYYKTMVRENLGRHVSTMIVVPSLAHADKIYESLKNGIEDRIVVAHSKKTKKHIAKVITQVSEGKDPVVLIATAPFSTMVRNDWETVVVEQSSSPYYRYEFGPVFDMRFFVEKIAASFGARLVYADTLIGIELRARIESHDITDLRSTWHIAKPEATAILDMKDEQKFSSFHPTTLRMMKEMVSRKSNLLLITTRKGLAPLTVCSDCGTTVTCPNCGTPLVLHRKKPKDVLPGESENSRIYMCHNCTYTTRPIDRCTSCGSWKLTMLGISTDSIRLELEEKFPTVRHYLCDGDSTPTPASVQKTMTAWLADPGSVLIGTSLVLPYIQSAPYGCIISMDSLLSIPSYTGAFHGLHTALSFLEKMTVGAIIQTRNTEYEPIQAINSESLLEFIKGELSSRKQFGYPPAKILVKVSLEVLKSDLRSATDYFEKCFAAWNPDILAKKSQSLDSIIIQTILKIEPADWNNERSPIHRTLSELAPECKKEVNPESVL